MNLPQVVSRDEWRAARTELLIKEKDITRAHDAVNAERRRLPMVAIDKEYLFTGTNGTARLLDLFDGRCQLIVYHFMFAPDWDGGCPICSFLVDSIGHLAHLHAAHTTLAVVARAPWATLARFRERMGWTVPFYSSFGGDFNYDFHVTLDNAVAPGEYNYQATDDEGENGGASVFLRDGDRVYHTYSSYARGVDILHGTFNYLDLTPLGRQEDAGIMNWIRRHDTYTDDGVM